MLNTTGQIAAHDIVYDILPKLKATEDLVNSTLKDMIEQAPSEEIRTQKLLQQQEFELQITMIRMNLDHLLKRYSKEVQAAWENDQRHAGALLSLDQHERFAIDRAKELYERARTIQTA